jgi:hypothetical protein
MHFSAEQLDIASQIDAKVQRLAGEGNGDVAIFVELVEDMPAFRQLLDAGPHVMDQLCLRFGGFYRYAKILEAIAAGIASGEIRVPK